jgi:D-inositol-3-phosphate glycosyltransferase
MRIVVVSNYSPPHIGGVEVLVDREVRLLARAGHEVRLISSACGVGRCPDYPENVQVERIPAWNVLERAFEIPWPFFSPRLIAALWRGVRWCDLVHTHGFLGFNTLVALFIARLLGRSSLLTEHAGPVWYRQRWKRALQTLAIQSFGRSNVWLADRSFVCHDRVSRVLNDLTRGRREVEHLMFPLDRTLFRPRTEVDRAAARRKLGWPADRRKVLFVGRLSARKGVDLLLQAQDDDFDLVFCGPGDPSLLHPIAPPRVTYLGPQPQQALLDLYHAADVLALPSRSEGNLVLVAQEALTCGLPVLLGDDPGLARYRECPGLHFTSLVPEAIRAALRTMLKSAAPDWERPAIPLSAYLPTEDEWVERLLSSATDDRPVLHHDRTHAIS